MFSLQTTSVFNLFYMGTDPDFPKPGDMMLILHKDGLKLKRGFHELGTITPDRMVCTTLNYNVGTAGLSASGALAGGLLAGQAGAIAGQHQAKARKRLIHLFH